MFSQHRSQRALKRKACLHLNTCLCIKCWLRWTWEQKNHQVTPADKWSDYWTNLVTLVPANSLTESREAHEELWICDTKNWKAADFLIMGSRSRMKTDRGESVSLFEVNLWYYTFQDEHTFQQHHVHHWGKRCKTQNGRIRLWTVNNNKKNDMGTQFINFWIHFPKDCSDNAGILLAAESLWEDAISSAASHIDV